MRGILLAIARTASEAQTGDRVRGPSRPRAISSTGNMMYFVFLSVFALVSGLTNPLHSYLCGNLEDRRIPGPQVPTDPEAWFRAAVRKGLVGTAIVVVAVPLDPGRHARVEDPHRGVR